MKKSLTFFGLGIVVVALIGFLFRQINLPVFQGRSLWLIIFGALGIAMIIMSFIFKKAKKFFLWFGLGSLAYALVVFGMRVAGLNNNIALFIFTLIAGLLFLIIGLVKRG